MNPGFCSLQQSSEMLVLVQVNADEHGPLGEKFGVRGFPTIKFFARGQSTASPEE
jgi:protein disulfide-isomerase A6